MCQKYFLLNKKLAIFSSNNLEIEDLWILDKETVYNAIGNSFKREREKKLRTFTELRKKSISNKYSVSQFSHGCKYLVEKSLKYSSYFNWTIL